MGLTCATWNKSFLFETTFLLKPLSFCFCFCFRFRFRFRFCFCFRFRFWLEILGSIVSQTEMLILLLTLGSVYVFSYFHQFLIRWLLLLNVSVMKTRIISIQRIYYTKVTVFLYLTMLCSKKIDFRSKYCLLQSNLYSSIIVLQVKLVELDNYYFRTKFEQIFEQKLLLTPIQFVIPYVGHITTLNELCRNRNKKWRISKRKTFLKSKNWKDYLELEKE